jgi:prophage DNA circulation protein
MKKRILLYTSIVSFSILTGCSIFSSGNKTPSQRNISIAESKVNDAKEKIDDNVTDTVKQIRSTAAGVDYALSKVTNVTPSVEVARKLNDRTISLAGAPTVAELIKMQEIVDDLTSQLLAEQLKGQRLLGQKDADISKIQKQSEELQKNLDKKEEDFKKVSENVAKTSDGYKQTVDEVNSWFGLGGVVYGLKKFVKTCIISILVFGLIFFGLSIASNFNPVAKSIFGIFESFAAMIINTIKGLIPGSLNVSKLIPAAIHDEYKNTLTKIVDTVALLQSKEQSSEKKYTLSEVLTEMSKAMNDSEKGLIKTIKDELRW